MATYTTKDPLTCPLISAVSEMKKEKNRGRYGDENLSIASRAPHLVTCAQKVRSVAPDRDLPELL